MKLVWAQVFLLLILCAATSLLLLNFSFSSYHNLLKFSSSNVFAFWVLNTVVICIILAKRGTPSADEFDGFLPFHNFFYEKVEEEQTQVPSQSNKDNGSHHINNDVNDNDDNDDYDSDGYDGEDDDGGGDGDGDEEFGWEDDDDLESRIEEFISRVTKRWREELSREKPHNNCVD